MKFLTSFSLPSSRPGKYVHFASGPFEGFSEKPKGLLAESPHQVSLSDVQKLQYQADKLTEDEITRLNHLAEYHLSLVSQKKSDDAFPSRILWAIHDSPLLGRLHGPLRLKVKRIMKIKQDEIVEWSQKNIESKTKPEDITDQELIKMSRAYQHLRTYDDASVKETRTKLQERMVEIAQVVMEDFDYDKGQVTPKPGKSESLSRSQQVWLLQLYRFFPSSNFWADSEQAGKLKALAQKSLEQISTLIDTSDQPKNRASLVLFWDLIQELEEVGDEKFQKIFSPDVRQSLDRLVDQGNQARFLSWAEDYFDGNPKVLLEEHLKALIQIRDDYPDLGLTKDIAITKDEIKDYIAAEALKRINEAKAADADEVTLKDLTPEQVAALKIEQEDLKTQKAAKDALLKKAEEALTGQKEAAIKNLFEEESVNWILTNEEADKVVTLQESIRKIQEDTDFKNWSGKRQDKTINEEDKGKLQEKEKEIEKHQKELNTLKSKVAKQKAITNRWEARRKIFLDPGGKATELLEKYKKDLKARSESRQLHSADLQILLDQGDTTVKQEVDGVVDTSITDFIRRFRGKIKGVLLDIAHDTDMPQDPLNISAEDRFAPWNRILDQAFGIANVLDRLQGSAIYDELQAEIMQKDLSAKELIDASIQHFRSEIAKIIRGKLNATPEEGDAFVGQYHRWHQGLKESTEYKALTEKRKTLEDKQQAFAKTSQESMQKVHHLFEKGDLKSLWNQIEKYVGKDKIGISKVEGARNKLRVAVPGTDFSKATPEVIFMALFEDHITRHRWSINRRSVESFLTEDVLSDDIDHNIKDQIVDAAVECFAEHKGLSDVSKAVSFNYDRLSGGEHTEFPGSTVLHKVELQLHSSRMGLKNQFAEYQDQFQGIKDAFDIDPDNKKRTTTLLREIRSQLVPHLRQEKDDIRRVLDHLIQGKELFKERYLDHVEAQIEALESAASDYEQLVEKSDDFSVGHEVFIHVPNMFGYVEKSLCPTEIFDGKEGDHSKTWGDRFASLEESQKELPRTVSYLKDELGLFEPEGEKKARAQFEALQHSYDHTYKRFDQNVDSYLAKLQRDVYKLSEEEFAARHKKKKNQALSEMDQLRSYRGTFADMWGTYGDRHFFDGWINRYKNDDARADAIEEFETWTKMDDQVALMDKVNDNYVNWIAAYQDALKYDEGKGAAGMAYKAGQGMERFMQSFGMLSISGIIGAFEESVDIFRRVSERRLEEEKATLGKFVFGEKGAWGIGYEFTRKATEAEESRVDEYKARYKRMNEWELKGELYEIRNPGEKDKARALIDILVEQGRISWDDTLLWEVINGLNEGKQCVKMVADDSNMDSGAIARKLRQACETIWDDYVFTAWNGSLEGNYKSAVESNFREFVEMETAGDRGEILADMLGKWARGEPDSTVDAAKYEGFLQKAFDDGKMNGTPDQRWFYFIMGMTTINPRNGQPLVSQDMVNRFDSSNLLARVPYLDFFTEKRKLWRKDGKIVPPGTPGAEEREAWNNDDYKAWGEFFGSDGRYGYHHGNPVIQAKCMKFFYHYIVQTPNALMRVDRMARNLKSEADHDDAQMWFAGISFQGMVQALNRASEGTDLVTPDFGASLIQGYQLYMQAQYEYIVENDMIFGKDHEGWAQMRKDVLLKVGEQMRVAFGALHTLAGNYRGGSAQTPLTVDGKFWRENLYDIKGHKDLINGSIKELLEANEVQDMDEYEEVWKAIGSQDISENFEDRKGHDDYKRIYGKIGDIVGGMSVSEEADETPSYFANTDAIEKILFRVGSEKGGMMPDGKRLLDIEPPNMGARMSRSAKQYGTAG